MKVAASCWQVWDGKCKGVPGEFQCVLEKEIKVLYNVYYIAIIIVINKIYFSFMNNCICNTIHNSDS